MKKEIMKIQRYFISKIEKGEFELKETVNDHAIKILIDSEYKFNLFFIQDGSVYCHDMDNFISLPDKEIDGTILIERVKAQSKLAKLKAIEKLQKEVEKL